uniref:Reverse transcriptase Ty1/copia-type domain-containing protein n=1 Tax=Lactuca sativa TaxID=4236 RepID=A0A9R1VQY7_LACSA|nr:hypothetical protein LSAT_V11C400159620 [Lactuca sativa]
MTSMNDEMSVLIRNQTWELVPKPDDVNPISCKYKARLVAHGFSQQFGLDYEDTFSPVAKLTRKGWNLCKMDVCNAFLYGNIDHVIHMEQPLGFRSETRPSYVCKLKKALYGLKQSPRAWYGKIA